MCIIRVPLQSILKASRIFAALAAIALVSAPAKAQLQLDLLPVNLPPAAGSLLGAELNLTLGDLSVDASLLNGRAAVNLSIPTGYVLRDVSCPSGIAVTASGTGVTLTPSAGAQLGGCILQIVDVVTASAAAVPAILQRNEVLLSVELGLDQQLDRFGSDVANDSFPKPSGLGGQMSTVDTERMGLIGSSDSAPLSFSTSLQQARLSQRAPPQMLGAGARPLEAPVSRSFNIWTEGYLARVETDDRYGDSDGHTGVLFVGADYLVSPHLLLGLLVQYDDQKRKFDDAPLEFNDSGWLAGPYAVIRLTDQVFFQGRAAWGQSQNDIRLGGVFDDSFDSDRWLVKGRLLANLRSGAWLVRPSVSIAYVEDELDGYHSSSGVDIGTRKMSLGQAKFGPEIAYRYLSDGYVITPSLTLEGIWNFEQNNTGLGFDDLVDTNSVRGRVEAGTTFQDARGVSLGLAATYDGIGTRDFTAIGGRARVNVPLN